MSDGSTSGPRPLRTGSTSQGLLVTLLGDYWFGRPVHIPSAALVTLLGDFGISEQAARAALSRVQRTGWLEGVKEGRRTSYRLSERAAETTMVIGRRILAFAAESPDVLPAWNRCWTVVAYSLAADQSDDRRRMRRRLRRLGFGPLHDALWISPRQSVEVVQRVLAPIEVARLSIFEGATLVDLPTLDVVETWHLDVLAERYLTLTADLETLLARVGEATTPTEALVIRTEAMDAWRPMRWIDPRLPPELLPADWPGWQARSAFAAVYDRLGDLAEQRVREVVSEHAEEAAAAVHHDTVADPR